MLKYLSPFLVIAGLVFVGVQAMDREWLADYEKNTGKSARFANSDDECRSNEHFDNRYGLCIKMREFTTDDNL
uniref:Uncharacterized protein n=1 Tax=Podoviridae sp. ct53O25 TaxID=2826539 RepID=A0A8S5MBW8_9CAUD|nr:MAG TPA: hypothetical protein [Podoviridae sp. ct53O25]